MRAIAIGKSKIEGVVLFFEFEEVGGDVRSDAICAQTFDDKEVDIGTLFQVSRSADIRCWRRGKCGS